MTVDGVTTEAARGANVVRGLACGQQPGPLRGGVAPHACNGNARAATLPTVSRAPPGKRALRAGNWGGGGLLRCGAFRGGGGERPTLATAACGGASRPPFPGLRPERCGFLPKHFVQGIPHARQGPGAARSGAERAAGARGGAFAPAVRVVGEVQPRLGECWARLACRIYPRVSLDFPNNPIRGPFERFGGLLGGVATTLGAVATIYGCNSPQRGCNSPQHGQSGSEKRFCSPGAGAHPATHAPPTAPLVVVAARRSRATAARDRPSRPTEATDGQRERARMGESGAGRGLGRGRIPLRRLRCSPPPTRPLTPGRSCPPTGRCRRRRGRAW
ncbi:hypothetical protein ABH941_000319 [Streptacidiphilus sp. EB103A]